MSPQRKPHANSTWRNFWSTVKITHGSLLQNRTQDCTENAKRDLQRPAEIVAAYVRFMLDAMSKLGCDVDPDKHLLCEPCDPKLVGGFDHDAKEMFLCENAIYTQSAMENVLTHELIHAYDNCRIKYDPDNVKHLACTEIRAANLSGDCWFSKEAFGRFKFRWRAHQQECVKTRAVKSMLCVRNISKEEAEKVVDSVFDACFHDTEPFERIPP